MKVKEILDQRGVGITEILREQAGKEPLQDRFYCGYLAAVRDFLLVTLEDVKETE